MKYILIILSSTLFLSCVSTKTTSIIYSDHYDKNTDLTTVMILPYGQVKIPGKWTKTKENTVSNQDFFIGGDSVEIAIALQPWNKYEFSANNPEVNHENFVSKFYEWDASYLKNQINGQLRIVKENKESNYLIWNLNKEPKYNYYYLFGLKGETAYNLYISTTNKWNEDQKVKFLERLYLD